MTSSKMAAKMVAIAAILDFTQRLKLSKSAENEKRSLLGILNIVYNTLIIFVSMCYFFPEKR